MKGIMFKPDMIQAIVEGRKIQTRRVIKPQPIAMPVNITHWGNRYQVGGTVYIKEAWQVCGLTPDGYSGGYEAGYPLESIPKTKPDFRYALFYALNGDEGPFRSPLFMPEWAARYFLKILAVRAERLQEITEEDAIKEGIDGDFQEYPRLAFSGLWDSINPKHPWESNPWVWVYEFELLKEEK